MSYQDVVIMTSLARRYVDYIIDSVNVPVIEQVV